MTEHKFINPNDWILARLRSTQLEVVVPSGTSKRKGAALVTAANSPERLAARRRLYLDRICLHKHSALFQAIPVLSTDLWKKLGESEEYVRTLDYFPGREHVKSVLAAYCAMVDRALDRGWSVGADGLFSEEAIQFHKALAIIPDTSIDHTRWSASRMPQGRCASFLSDFRNLVINVTTADRLAIASVQPASLGSLDQDIRPEATNEGIKDIVWMRGSIASRCKTWIEVVGHFSNQMAHATTEKLYSDEESKPAFYAHELLRELLLYRSKEGYAASVGNIYGWVAAMLIRVEADSNVSRWYEQSTYGK